MLETRNGPSGFIMEIFQSASILLQDKGNACRLNVSNERTSIEKRGHGNRGDSLSNVSSKKSTMYHS